MAEAHFTPVQVFDISLGALSLPTDSCTSAEV